MDNRELIKVKAKQGTILQIAKLFGVSRQWASRALSGKTNSETAKKIRQAAVNAGGDGIYR